jgi:alpha-glucosidase
MLRIESRNDIVNIYLGKVDVLRHSFDAPMLEIGRADFHYKTSGGGLHRISNPVDDWVTLHGCEVNDDGVRLFNGEISCSIIFEQSEDGFSFAINLPDGFNYARLILPAEREEAIYGGGVQFSHLNLRGRRFPIWTSEMGLGRHPLRPYTWLANMIADAGGEYWNTYFPQASFLSTRGYGCLVDTGGYSVLDFSPTNHHRLEVLGGGHFHFFTGKDLGELVGRQAVRLGVMPEPPRWVFEGGILGIQGGLPYVRETVDRVLASGAQLTGIWTQDWAGVRIFWQGKRLFWNWVLNQELYPDMKAEIRRRSEQGIRWLTYINPYFNAESDYFKLAKDQGYLVKDDRGQALVYQVAGFWIGSVDLTNPQAWCWFKEDIIKQNMLDLGIRGWMADYAEDMPEQARFFDGRNGTELHNLYPRLWAQLNREAVEEAGLQDEVLIFHRAGFGGATSYMNMNWGGDQVVYWNPNDGFPSGVTGGLSGCMSGVQYYHSDAGGYFSFRWIKRTREVLFRWCEANAFSPILRTHEGNRPWAGVQPWQDEETLRHFASMTRFHAALAPYLAHVSAQAQQSGIGMMRPFCLTNPGPEWQDKSDAYYLGDDLLVYPVMRPRAKHIRIEIPEDEWVGLFNGKEYSPGAHRVDCPIGKPVIYYRRESEFARLFKGIGKMGMGV